MGYIKLFRKIQEWGWYDDPNTLALWVHLLLDANWKERLEWHGVSIERGSMITSVAKISTSTGLSERQVRTCLGHLTKTGEIKMEATNKWTKITICKYDSYQGDDGDERQTTDEQPTSNRQATDKQSTTIEEVKKDKVKKENKQSLAESVDRIYKLYPSSTRRPEGNTVTLKTAKKNKAAIERMLASKEQTEESLSYIIRRYLEETTPEYLQRFETFLNQLPDYDDKTETPQESPDEILRKAANPTKEQIQRWFKEYFVVIHPKEDGEDREHYWGRMRETYERELGGWIERRVEMARQKLL